MVSILASMRPFSDWRQTACGCKRISASSIQKGLFMANPGSSLMHRVEGSMLGSDFRPAELGWMPVAANRSGCHGNGSAWRIVKAVPQAGAMRGDDGGGAGVDEGFLLS